MRRLIFGLCVLFGLVTPSLSAVEKWVNGATAGSFAAACAGEINSLPTLDAVLCSVVVSNASNLDLTMDVSVSLGSVTTGAGSPYVGVYIYPLNQDGTTYGDGQFGSQAAGPPSASYLACNIPAPASTTGAIVGSCMTAIPPANYKIVLYNGLLVTMAGSNTVKYQTFNRQVN